MPGEPTTFPALLVRNAADAGEAAAIVTEDRSITHASLDAESRALAARLVAAGVGKSSRVGLLAPNGIEWAVLAAAVLRVGGVLVPLSTLLRPPELAAQLKVAEVTHLVAARHVRGRTFLDDLAALEPELPLLRAVWPLDELPRAAVDAELVVALEDAVRPADDLTVLFTSGSRGEPKGVIHTHGATLRATAASLDARCIGRGDRLYTPMPFFWTGGFATGLLSALVGGATLLTEAQPEPTRTLSFLQRERVTLFRGWPDQAAALAAHPAFGEADLSSLRDASLGALLPPERRPAPGARPNIFGMTESFGPYCGDRLDTDLPPAKFGSCGRPFVGVEVRIVDPETTEVRPAGEQGEIWLRGPNLLRGICGRLRSSVFTADGFYRTGDLGRLDADDYLWYGGRLDDMFKVKGATVYPAEVEAALRSLPAVRQVYVTDVTTPDGRSEVGAMVVTDAPIDELVDRVRERLSAFKVPTRWLVVPDADAVPMSSTGKVDKPALQRLLRERGEAAARAGGSSQRSRPTSSQAAVLTGRPEQGASP